MATQKPRRKTAHRKKPAPTSAHRPAPFAIAPPIEPMLAKLTPELPETGAFVFEPKWDGFRAVIFRGDSDVFIQSRDLRPFDRYFPDLHELCLEKLPRGCATAGGMASATVE